MDPHLDDYKPGPEEPFKLMCMICGHTITAGSEEHEKANVKGNCPECGAFEPPAIANVKPYWSMTWQEMRTLTIWAERWAVYCDTHPAGERGPNAPDPPPMRKIIRGIVDRLTFQHLGPPLLLSQILAEDASRPGVQMISQNVDPDAPLYNAPLTPEQQAAFRRRGQPNQPPQIDLSKVVGPYGLTLIIDNFGREVLDLDIQFATEALLRTLPGTPMDAVHWYTRTDLFRQFMAKTSTFRGTMSHGPTMEPTFDACLGDDPHAAIRIVNVKEPE